MSHKTHREGDDTLASDWSRRSVLQTGVATSAAVSLGAVGSGTALNISNSDASNVELLTDAFNVRHVFDTETYSLFFGQGLQQSRGILPPSNSGYLTLEEFLEIQEHGPEAEPDRLSDQLELYENFEYKPLPVTRDQVERVTETTDTISADAVSEGDA